MTSIVQTLRDLADCKHSDLSVASEAADEITRLTARVAELEAMLRTASDMNEVYEGRLQELEAALDLYREAVRIDVTMEGPKFMGANASALKRAWDADRAALSQPAKEDTND